MDVQDVQEEKQLVAKENNNLYKGKNGSVTHKGGKRMKSQVQKKPVSAEEHQKMIQSVAGTMAIEGLTLSEASRRNIDRYASGQANFQQIMAELKAKYQRAE